MLFLMSVRSKLKYILIILSRLKALALPVMQVVFKIVPFGSLFSWTRTEKLQYRSKCCIFTTTRYQTPQAHSVILHRNKTSRTIIHVFTLPFISLTSHLEL
jgi:hypothetical protein